MSDQNEILMKIHEGIGVLRGEVTGVVGQVKDMRGDVKSLDDKIDDLSVNQSAMVTACQNHREAYTHRLEQQEKKLEEQKTIKLKKTEATTAAIKWGIGILVSIVLAVVGLLIAS